MKLQKCEQFLEGLHWVYENSKGETLSIICHKGSYGREKGLFEVMPSWKCKLKGDAVVGHQTFGDVQKWINKLKTREGC